MTGGREETGGGKILATAKVSVNGESALVGQVGSSQCGLGNRELRGAGGVQYFRSVTTHHLAKHAPRLFPETVPGNCVRWMVPRPRRWPEELPNFGLIYGAVILAVLFIFMILPDRAPYRGLHISLGEPRKLPAQDNPWPETLGVYLGKGERLYVNGQAVAKEQLGARLQQELNRRVEWTVYFEADRDTLNMNAIYAIDTIQGLGAKLVWITPKTREEMTNKASAYWTSTR
jgi:biopolymer transport protein ExbD